MALLLGVATPAQGGDPADPVPDEVFAWVQDLWSRDGKVRERAVDLLGTSAGAVAVPSLVATLRVTDDESSAQRVDAAAAAVAMHGARAGYVRLISRLDDRRPEVLRWLERAARGVRTAVEAPVAEGWAPAPPASPGADPALAWWRWVASASDKELTAPRTRSMLRGFYRGPAWLDFLQAISVLEDEGNRRSAARLFAAMAARFPEDRNAKAARELAQVLEGMAVEDEAYRAPEHPASLPVEQRITWLVHRLRDLKDRPFVPPARERNAKRGAGTKPAGELNPAIELVALGEAAIPAVVALLEDRRVTRSIAYWDDNNPIRTVHRYQDVAVEILERLLPFPPYRGMGPGSLLSMEAPEAHRLVRQRVDSWLEEWKRLDPAERPFRGAAIARCPRAIEILRNTAATGGPKDRVLRELARFYDDPAKAEWRPEICEAMCELGDRSRLADVLAAFPSDQPLPKSGGVWSPDTDDPWRAVNARETVKRLRATYGAAPEDSSMR